MNSAMLWSKMENMSSWVPTMIGVDHRGITKKARGLVPEYMVMGERGMADMTEMTMPIPDNTIPMMTGDGPFGSVEMGGMFSVVKVRKDQKPGDYSDPGWYKHPARTVAFEYEGAGVPAPATSSKGGKPAMKSSNKPEETIELKVRKPQGHSGH